jgi:hypothetical protein
MVSWADFAREEPELAGRGEALFEATGLCMLGTLRANGFPRISPVEPLFWNGDLWLSMGLGTMKARDLHRDPRVLVHSVVTNRDGGEGEFKVRGRAVPEDDPAVQARVSDFVSGELGWRPEIGSFHLFRIDVEDATFIRWDGRNNDQYLARWPPGLEQVRRGTSATSNGPPEPHREFLD